MKLPDRVLARLWNIPLTRKPDEIIGPPDNPYMERWYVVPKTALGSVYLHHFLRSDDDRALHDHPGASLSFLLSGFMVEWIFAAPRLGPAGGFRHRRLAPGAVTFRRASLAHRIELPPVVPVETNIPHMRGWSVYRERPEAWSLFIMGPRVRPWGFHCPNGWVPWQLFTKPGSGGKSSEIGPGCG